MRLSCYVTILLGAAVSLPAQAATLYGGFSGGAEGWSLFTYTLNPAIIQPGGTGPTWQSGSDTPATYISAEDSSDGRLFFEAPGTWTGNFLGGFLSFSIRNANSQNYSFLSPNGYQSPSVMIEGGGTTLFYGAHMAVSGVDWTYNHLSLTTATGWSTAVSSNVPATQLQFETVLSDLTGLYISADWVNGYWGKSLQNDALYGHDITDLAQVTLSDVPEPSSLILMGIGLVLVGGGFMRKAGRRA